MFWICENQSQINKLSYNKPCFVSVIPLNHNYHPSLSGVSLIYIKSEGHKGYIFPINHNDGISIEIELVKEFILKHPSIYVLNKKEILFQLGEEFNLEKVVDINLIHLESTIHSLDIPNYKSIVAGYIEGAFKNNPNLNSFIPITKHYEEQEQIYNYIKEYIGKNARNTFYQQDYTWVMYCVEKQGIALNLVDFRRHFNLDYPEFSIKDNKIFTQYNLYNFTSRPSNSFNGVNYAALNKSDGTREFIVPEENYLFEYDFRAYHLYLSAKLIGFDLPQGDIHTELGKMYFKKEELNEEEYKKSKQLSFKMMNGGVYSQYKDVPFWNKLSDYISESWIDIQEKEYIELAGGRILNLNEIQNPTPQKLYNFFIQSMETFNNIEIVKYLLEYLNNKKSKCILYTYDSVIIDYKQEDGKKVLNEIKKIMEMSNFQVSVSYGKNYDNMVKLT